MRYDKKDTIRTEFWGSAVTGSVGQLAHPFADKISKRIRDAKLLGAFALQCSAEGHPAG